MRRNRKQSSWSRSTDQCSSTPTSGFFEMDALEGETRRVVECLEAEGVMWVQVKLGMLTPRGMEWGYCEMPHRTGFPVTTAENWDISPESAGLLEEALRRVEATLTWRGRARVRVEELLEGGSRAWYRLRTGSRRLLRGLWFPTRNMRSTRGGRR